MQIHQLQPQHKNKGRKRVGRGGKRGTYSGRGVKGQKSRAGRKLQPIMRELIKRYPKIRGYRQELKPKHLVALNLEVLEKNFEAAGKITPGVLVEKKIIRKIRGVVPLVKILSKGELTKPLNIEDCLVSKQTRVKIEKAGGIVNSKFKIQKELLN